MSSNLLDLPRNLAFERLRQRLGPMRPVPPSRLLPSGVPALDHLLGGGFPRGGLILLEGAMSSGCRALAARLLAQASREGLVAICEESGLYPPLLARAGVDLRRLLVLPVGEPLALLRSADLLLRGSAVAMLLLPDLPARGAHWLRIGSAARTANALVLICTHGAFPELSSSAQMRVHARLERVLLSAGSERFTRFLGYEIRLEVLKSRHTRVGASVCVRALVGNEPTMRARVLIGSLHSETIAR